MKNGCWHLHECIQQLHPHCLNLVFVNPRMILSVRLIMAEMSYVEIDSPSVSWLFIFGHDVKRRRIGTSIIFRLNKDRWTSIRRSHLSSNTSNKIFLFKIFFESGETNLQKNGKMRWKDNSTEPRQVGKHRTLVVSKRKRRRRRFLIASIDMRFYIWIYMRRFVNISIFSADNQQ